MNSNRKEDMEISSHYRQLLRELNEQRQHGILCDACVIVEGKIFKAHKNVLLGSSRYFKTLYCQVKKGAEPHHQTTVTHLDIVTATGFKAILDFMYSAHLALTSKNVIEVMSAASYLQMTDIVQACHGFIKAALDISIRSELADELADFEMGAVAAAGICGGGIGGGGGGIGGERGGGGLGGVASEALASIISGGSSSPWLERRTSPANSSGDSAIASCHEGSGSTYGKEDQETPKSHESQEDGGHDSQHAWPQDYRPVTVKEEQASPSSTSHPRERLRVGAGAQGVQGGGGDGAWQPSGSGRRKNRKNKDTVRHITQQTELDRDSRPGSPLPPVMGVTRWSYNGQDIPGADVTEPNSSDSRGERLDFFLKQEEALTMGEANFLAASESDGAGGGTGGGTTPSVANLRAALMSKNSLLSLRAEMLGDDNPVLFEFMPKGGHSLSRLHHLHHQQQHLRSATIRPGATTGATFDSKQGAASFSSPSPLPLLLPPPLPPPPPSFLRPPTLPLQPSEAGPLMAPELRAGGPSAALHSRSEELAMNVEENPEGPEPSEPPPEDEEDSKQGYNTVLECGPSPMERDQMAEGRHGVSRVDVSAGRGSGALSGPAWPQELACSLCKRLFSSLEHLREHEYRHTLSLTALSLDWPDPQGPLADHHHNQTQAYSQSLYCLPVAEHFPPRYLCSQCPATFTLKSNADRHEKTIHFKRKLMQCTYCLKQFRDRTDLHRHLSSVHSRERGHSCPACAKAFSTQKNLATHVKVCYQLGVESESGRGV
uniref:Zinc finger and BTB domain-containing protein 46 n=2 Tax=Oncorhynchus tshawytscha TaxID=74940 RepID=A0A8C8MFV2_ONCTS